MKILERIRRHGDERELMGRKDAGEMVDTRPLSAAERDRYALEWRQMQALYFDDQDEALRYADSLISRIMRERGYVVAESGRLEPSLTVDDARLADMYQEARASYRRFEAREASTEDLRQAMTQYRSLFEALIAETEAAATADGEVVQTGA